MPSMEKTDKKWKKLFLVSGGLVLVALWALTIPDVRAALCLLGAALACLVIAKVGAWWTNG